MALESTHGYLPNGKAICYNLSISPGGVMADTSKSALELLEQMRTERAELDMLIQGLEKRLGIVAQSNESNSSMSSSPRVTVSLDSIPVGFFHNLSQVAATEKLLRMSPGHPLTTNEILDTFRKSGMEVHAKHAVTGLYTALRRNPKFERVAGSAWGLAEWYPQKRRQKDEESAADDGEKEK
jgi:hypothetical protein